jgi:hypothetical protein
MLHLGLQKMAQVCFPTYAIERPDFARSKFMMRDAISPSDKELKAKKALMEMWCDNDIARSSMPQQMPTM